MFLSEYFLAKFHRQDRGTGTDLSLSLCGSIDRPAKTPSPNEPRSTACMASAAHTQRRLVKRDSSGPATPLQQQSVRQARVTTGRQGNS